MPTAIDPTQFIPDGSFTLSKRPAAFPTGVWGHALDGHGPYVRTATKTYLDCMCALGALTVGHSHPHIVDAVTRQLIRGTIYSLPSKLEMVVSERLCGVAGVIPCAAQVRVVKTGSEACSAAVRIARMATGRSLVVTNPTSYHGWHDELMAAKPSHPGVVGDHAIRTLDFYNKSHRLEDVVATDGVAAVIFEPVQGEPPADGFLQQVVDVCRRHGTVVIFDEMLCGGRLALGGAQEYYGVIPDLATFGKALGGGLPFAFVCGRRDLMKHAWPISGTFSGDALALAAANAMLDIYDEEPVITKLWRYGAALKNAIMRGAEGTGVTVVLCGHDPRFWLEFGPSVDKRLALSVFSQQCAARGVLVHPAVIFANAAMIDEEVARCADAMEYAMRMVCTGIAENRLPKLLDGEQYADSVR